jgi:hypothetical protein
VIEWTTSAALRLTSARLTDVQVFAARVLGGPREVGGIVQVEMDGSEIWGRLLGQVVNRGGLTLSPIVYPSYEQALRGEHVLGPETTADDIDRAIAERRADIDAWEVARHGGARAGSGRKAVAGTPQTERINLTLTEAERAEIEDAVPEGDPVGRWIVEAALMRSRAKETKR